MTVVIDCNVIVMCLSTRSPYHFIFKSLIKGSFNLAVTVDIVLEYEEVVQQKFSPTTAHAFSSLLKELQNVQHISPYYKWQLIDVDPDDNKYCDCALAGSASYIVTEDNHFGVLKNIPFPSITIISIDTFLAMLLAL